MAQAVSWQPIESLTDVQLVRAAHGRYLARLRTGKVATLVCWPGDRRLKSRTGRTVRLETARGARFTVRPDAVEAVRLPEEEQ